MEHQFQPQILERKEKEMHDISLLESADEKLIDELLEMRKRALAHTEEYSDAREYYCDSMNDPRNINIILKNKEKLIGYLLAVPHNKIVEELREDDPMMKEDDQRLYVETTEIDPDIAKTLAGGKFFFKMLGALIDEAAKREMNRFSMHARVDTGLSRALQKYFGTMLTEVRHIEHWKWNGNEPSDYIEGTYEKK